MVPVRASTVCFKHSALKVHRATRGDHAKDVVAARRAVALGRRDVKTVRVDVGAVQVMWVIVVWGHVIVDQQVDCPTFSQAKHRPEKGRRVRGVVPRARGVRDRGPYVDSADLHC